MGVYDRFAELLALAEALGWPAGVTCPDREYDDKLIVVAGGSEAAWRAWTERYGGGDIATSMWCSLNIAVEMIEAGIDPGPPETWSEQASADAAEGEAAFLEGALEARRRRELRKQRGS
jgi:hypothetical protein